MFGKRGVCSTPLLYLYGFMKSIRKRIGSFQQAVRNNGANCQPQTIYHRVFPNPALYLLQGGSSYLPQQ